MKNKSNITKYGLLSGIYDLVFNPFLSAARKKSLSMIEFKKNEKVLIVGVGTGLDLPLIPAGIKVIGVDLSESMLEKADKKPSAAEITLMQMNAEQLKFKNNTFDVVILNLILSVVEDPQKAMKEAVRVLKKGGRMLVWDKFSASKNPGIIRKALNVMTSFIGTDITRNFEEIAEGMKLGVLQDEAGMFGGNYRSILLRKK